MDEQQSEPRPISSEPEHAKPEHAGREDAGRESAGCGQEIAHKLVPRNQTALSAKHEPRGNPPGTRPDSGPDNCFPGLDFDQRNIESGFFPGLRFSFHLGDDGVIVTDVLPQGPAADAGITRTHLPLFLWGVMGRTQSGQKNLEDIPSFSFQSLDALQGWARIRDLLPGTVAILLGRLPPRIPAVPGEGRAKLRDAYKTKASHVERVKGALQWIVLVADRAKYLDEHGVIDPQVYDEGELTRSLCAPWQFDFRDCACFFWAANKPDVVTSVDGQQPFAFYMRRNREGTPPPDILDKDDQRQPQLDYAPLIGGAWNDVLPVVLNDREVATVVAAPTPSPVPVMTPPQFIAELRYLATVEHALAVQYLYAHYSLKAPMILTQPPPSNTEAAIFAAAREIFDIAVDEMRHLRWVNEALDLLGKDPELGRAHRIGRTLNHKFELVPLTPQQLQWFIDVEEPSQHEDREASQPPSGCEPDNPQNVDGMYVRLLASVGELGLPGPKRERMEQLIKLIIDEGNDHYERFLSVRAHLGSLPPKDYLRLDRVECNPKHPTKLVARLLHESDARYSDLLFTLEESFSGGNTSDGRFLEQSRRTMQNMHEINHLLATHHFGPRFTLPRRWRYDHDIPPVP